MTPIPQSIPDSWQALEQELRTCPVLDPARAYAESSTAWSHGDPLRLHRRADTGKQAPRILLQFALLLLLVLYGAAVSGSDIGACRTGSLQELEKTVREHNEQVYRVNSKFKDIWYFHGAVPADVGSAVTLEKVYEYLGELAPRRAAVLFHAVDNSRLCTWLITPDRLVVSHVANISQDEIGKLQPSRWQELAILTARTARVAEPSPPRTPLDRAIAKQRWDEILKDIGKVVLPEPITRRLIEDKTDTLIVVPISLQSMDIEQAANRELSSTMRLIFSISTVPDVRHRGPGISVVCEPTETRTREVP
jgi:hypothetical protein